MEELKDLLETAKKSKQSIDDGIMELNKLQAMMPKDTNPDAIKKINDAVAEVKRLKRQLDEHNSKR